MDTATIAAAHTYRATANVMIKNNDCVSAVHPLE